MYIGSIPFSASIIVRVFVTGSSGFIGFHLVKKLLNDGHEVVGIDDHNDYYNPALKSKRLSLLSSKNFSFYQTDINSLNINESNFDLAINLAAQAGVRVPKEKQHLYKHSNIDGFESFCNFCKKNNINKILYASSSSVYSDINDGNFVKHQLHSNLNQNMVNQNFQMKFMPLILLNHTMHQ